MLVGDGPTPNCSKHNTSAEIQEHQLNAILRFSLPSLSPGITSSQPGLPSPGWSRNDPALGHMRAQTWCREGSITLWLSKRARSQGMSHRACPPFPFLGRGVGHAGLCRSLLYARECRCVGADSLTVGTGNGRYVLHVAHFLSLNTVGNHWASVLDETHGAPPLHRLHSLKSLTQHCTHN